MCLLSRADIAIAIVHAQLQVLPRCAKEIVLEVARRAWYGHGPAGSFFVSGTILLDIFEERCDRERLNERCTCAGATACARAPRARARSLPVCACILLAGFGTQGRLKRAIFENVIFQGSSLGTSSEAGGAWPLAAALRPAWLDGRGPASRARRATARWLMDCSGWVHVHALRSLLHAALREPLNGTPAHARAVWL